MAVTAKWYGLAATGQWGTNATDRVDWATDVIRTALTTGAYTEDQDAHDYFNDITNELTTAGGYTQPGLALGTRTVTYVSASNETQLDAPDAIWTSASFTCQKAVVYKDSAGASSTDRLMGYVLMGADQTVSSGTFTIQWDATGVLKAVAA